jgi:hypothetical protein
MRWPIYVYWRFLINEMTLVNENEIRLKEKHKIGRNGDNWIAGFGYYFD